MIRLATKLDIPRLIEMGQRFHDESPYCDKMPWTSSGMEETARKLIIARGMLVSERNGKVVGMFGFIVIPHFLSGEITGMEIAWWVDPEFRGEGLKLLREAEKLSIQFGAKRMQMVAPTSQVGAVYERLGYCFVESTYQKTL